MHHRYSRVEWFWKIKSYTFYVVPNFCWTPIPKFHVLMLPISLVGRPLKMRIFLSFTFFKGFTWNKIYSLACLNQTYMTCIILPWTRPRTQELRFYHTSLPLSRLPTMDPTCILIYCYIIKLFHVKKIHSVNPATVVT